MSFFDDPPLHDFPDRAIRLLLAQPANLRELVEQLHPELAALLDFDRRHEVKRDFLLDSWKRLESDLLIEIPLLGTGETGALIICLLIEHQSRDDVWMPLRLLEYAVYYWERQRKAWQAEDAPRSRPKLTPVVPIVLHTGVRPWRAARLMHELLDGPDIVEAYAPEWRVLFWDLAEHTAEELRESAGAWMRTLAVVRAEQDEPEQFRNTFVEVLRRLEELAERDEVRRHDLLWFVLSWAIRRRPGDERAQFLSAAQAKLSSDRRRRELATMSEVITRNWEDEVFARGRESGLAEGSAQSRAEGRAQGKAEAVLRTLRARLGELPPELESAILNLRDEERLNDLLVDAALCTDLAAFVSRFQR